MIMSRGILPRTGNVSDKIADIQNRVFLLSNLFPPKSYRLWNNVDKYGPFRQATDDKWYGACALRAK